MNDVREVIDTTRSAYDRAFDEERTHDYPEVDRLEERLGYRLDRQQLEAAARTLACPLKVHAPNWQHGRVVYALTRARLSRWRDEDGPALLVDIGTAKGFSALCLLWAARDSGLGLRVDVVTVDVVRPGDRVRRNSVAELDGALTLPEFLAPWPEAQAIAYFATDSPRWQAYAGQRAAVVFIDGKHAYESVTADARRFRQDRGDVIVCDDVQMPGVLKAFVELRDYNLSILEAHACRHYGIAVKA